MCIDPYKAGQRLDVAWFYFQRLVEQIVGKLLLRPIRHRVQVLKEPLRKEDVSVTKP